MTHGAFAGPEFLGLVVLVIILLWMLFSDRKY
jgi:hypothetical protein